MQNVNILLNFIRLIIKIYSHKTPPQVTFNENLINVSRCHKTQDESKTTETTTQQQKRKQKQTILPASDVKIECINASNPLSAQKNRILI